MVAELLCVGAENAITGKELAAVLGCNIRDITNAVETERRNGQPICAATSETPGYFLAANEEELQEYCNRLHHRAAELYATRRALLDTLKQYADKRNQE